MGSGQLGSFRRPKKQSYSPIATAFNPVAIGRQISELQASPLRLSKDKTEQLHLASMPSALPGVRSGIRIKTQTAS